MFSKKLMLMSAAALMTGSVLLADDTAPPAATPAPAHHSSKLSKPYSQLSDLTDEQKTKIATIHGDFLEQEKALLDKEQTDIDAVLTDDQKEQLKTLQAAKKEKPAKKKEATTEPAQ